MKTKRLILSSVLVLGSIILLIAMFGIPGEEYKTITVALGKNIGQSAVTILGNKTGLTSVEDGMARFRVIESDAVKNVYSLSEGKGLAVVVDNTTTPCCFHNVWIEKISGSVSINIPEPPVPPSGTFSGTLMQSTSISTAKKETKDKGKSSSGFPYHVYYAGKPEGGDVKKPLVIDKVSYPEDPVSICAVGDGGGRLYVVYPGKDFKGITVNKRNASNGNQLQKKGFETKSTEPFKISVCMAEGKLLMAYEEKGDIQLKMLDYNLNIKAAILIPHAKNPEVAPTLNPKTINLTFVRGKNLLSTQIFIGDSEIDQGFEENVEDSITGYSGAGFEDIQVYAINKGKKLLLKENFEEVTISADSIKGELDNVVSYSDSEEISVVSFVDIKSAGVVEELKIAIKQ